MRIAGVGSSVIDLMYDLSPEASGRLGPYLSRAPGDGGLVRGGAVLSQTLERRFGRSFDELVAEWAGGAAPQRALGGVAVAALIAAAQLEPDGQAVRFHCNVSDGDDGDFVRARMARTPLSLDRIGRRPGRYPTSVILNEHLPQRGAERTFVAAAGMPPGLALAPDELRADFFDAGVNLYGAMWWEPQLSAALTALLRKSQGAGSVTVACTAFDPARTRGGERWPLGDSDQAYRHVDVLVMDRLEAEVYSGEADPGRALEFFRRSGVGAFVVTDGTGPVHYWSRGTVFAAADGQLPIAADVLEDQAKGLLPRGDSVGCGDNFVGGLTASLAEQLRAGSRPADLRQAVLLANLSAALASTHAGGVFPERSPGEKRRLVQEYRPRYERQLSRVA